MSEDIRTQQRWLIAGVAILIILIILVIVALFRSMQGSKSDPQIGSRFPAARLAYCSPGDPGLCVVSFGQVVDGDMMVNFKTPRFLYPEFILVINRYGVESTYACQRVKGLSNGVTCTGASQVPGEVLQFKVIARKDGFLLAEGKFPIIGIALSTPEDVPTETLEPPTATASPTGSPMPLPTSYPNLTPYPYP